VATYYTNVGPEQGPCLARGVPMIIDVLASPADPAPIGMALSTTPYGIVVTRWRLTIHDVELPGLWVVIDREFRPAP
jgi:hypothetical protein